MAIITSESWNSHVVSQSNQMCGELLFSRVTSSLIECAIVCLVQVLCFMFEYSMVTTVCDVYTGISHTNITPAVFSVPRVVYKGSSNCERSGYTYVKDGNICVNAVKEMFTWNDAKTKCETDQGRLLVVTSYAQIEGMRKYMRSINKPYTFVGLTDMVKEGRWEWIDGTQLNLSMFAIHDLNNYDAGYLAEKTNADCAILNLDVLHDVHCNTKRPVTCERPQLV